jgi:hypothetical protein
MVKYRIKHVDMIGYFAQVKKGIFTEWKTIGKHPNGFGEYNENHLDYPLQDQADAVRLAHSYAEYMGLRKGFTTYRDLLV